MQAQQVLQQEQRQVGRTLESLAAYWSQQQERMAALCMQTHMAVQDLKQPALPSQANFYMDSVLAIGREQTTIYWNSEGDRAPEAVSMGMIQQTQGVALFSKGGKIDQTCRRIAALQHAPECFSTLTEQILDFRLIAQHVDKYLSQSSKAGITSQPDIRLSVVHVGKPFIRLERSLPFKHEGGPWKIEAQRLDIRLDQEERILEDGELDVRVAEISSVSGLTLISSRRIFTALEKHDSC